MDGSAPQRQADPARSAGDAPRTPDPTKTYVSFVVSDGDSLGYDITLARALQFSHLGANSVPINISTSPSLATEAPAIWNWYLAHVPANAKLVAGPSGSGYFYPSYAPSSLYLDYQPVTPLSPTVSYTDGVPVTRVAMATNSSDIAEAIKASSALQSNGPGLSRSA